MWMTMLRLTHPRSIATVSSVVAAYADFSVAVTHPPPVAALLLARGQPVDHACTPPYEWALRLCTMVTAREWRDVCWHPAADDFAYLQRTSPEIDPVQHHWGECPQDTHCEQQPFDVELGYNYVDCVPDDAAPATGRHRRPGGDDSDRSGSGARGGWNVGQRSENGHLQRDPAAAAGKLLDRSNHDHLRAYFRIFDYFYRLVDSAQPNALASGASGVGPSQARQRTRE